MKNRFFWITILAAIIVFGALAFFLSRDNAESPGNTIIDSMQAYKDCVRNFPSELCGMYSAEGRIKLYETCSRLTIPATERDTTLYADNKLVVVRWRDNISQEDMTVYLPYEPETGFAGCSESVKELLQHVQEIGP